MKIEFKTYQIKKKTRQIFPGTLADADFARTAKFHLKQLANLLNEKKLLLFRHGRCHSKEVFGRKLEN